MKVLTLTFLLCIAPQVSLAILVARTGGDYLSIQDAINNAQPGDTIYVKAGTYNEKLEFTRSGTARGGPITLMNYENDRVILDGTDVEGAHLICIENKSSIIIQGLEIMNNLWVRNGSGIRIEGYGSNIEIRNMKIHGITGRNATALTVYGTSSTPIDNLIIENNEIYDIELSSSAALTINGNVRNFQILNNTIHDVNHKAIDLLGGESWTGGYIAQHGICKGNRVYGAISTKADGEGAGIHVDGASHISIEENRIYNNDIGIELGAWEKGTTTSDISVLRNIIHHNNKAGIFIGGYARRRGEVRNSRIFNNVLYENQLFEEGDGELYVQYASDINIHNNIIVAGKQGILYTSWGGDTNNRLDFNCYFITKLSDNYPFFVNDIGYQTFNAYQQATARDKNSLFINPHFTDESRFDFSLRDDSPCIDTGIDVGLEFTGKAPDIGALEKAEDLQIVQEAQPSEKYEEKKGTLLELEKISFENIFPVLHTYYDEHPFGSAMLRNWETAAAEDIIVRLIVKQFMDEPKMGRAPRVVNAGEAGAVEFTALFTDDILSITEGTKVSANITVSYTMKGKRYTHEYRETLRLYDRNASSWDDDRKAAAFVTARDPSVLLFAKNIAGVAEGRSSAALKKNLLQAIALFEGLSLHGIRYVIDPTSPYRELSRKAEEVDFLQFPRQTLAYRAGDCDDLSILYCALLESVGIETAFITIPEHMLMAFSIDMGSQNARRVFVNSDEFIFRDGKTWVPVEVTILQTGFMNAWQTGAKEWREAVSGEKEGFIPTHAAWKVYEPVGLPGDIGQLNLPVLDDVSKAYRKEVEKYLDSTVSPQAARIQAEIERSGGTPEILNRLGVLYARYGMLAEARGAFEKALELDKGYVPTLINMGNVYYVRENMDRALEYYEMAYENNPENTRVILSIARVNHSLENYGIVKQYYDRLVSLDPELASQFSHLLLRGEEAKRGAEVVEMHSFVIWTE